MQKEKRKLEITLPSDVDAKTLEALLTNEGLKILITTENGQTTQTIDATKAKITTEKSFMKVPQGKALNLFMETGIDKNFMGPIAKVENKGLMLTIENYQAIAGLRTTTKQLLLAIMSKWNEGDKKKLAVAIPLKEYMGLRDVSDVKEARKQVNEDLETLYNVTLKFGDPAKAKIDKKKKNDIDPYNFETRIISGKTKIVNSMIGVVFVPDFAKLMSKNFMQLPTLILAIKGNRDPNAVYFLDKFSALKNMMLGKKGEDLITVGKLMDASPDMKTYKEINNDDRAIRRRIYEPLEKGMDALKDILSWEYRDKAGNIVSRDEAKALQFHSYANLRISVHWKLEPLEGWKGGKLITKG